MLLILADEIYGELHFSGDHDSIARYYPEGTIVSAGLSKWCGAGGWRLGTFTFPPQLAWLREAMASVASETFSSTSAPIQHAAITAFEGSPEIDRYIAASRRILTALSAEVTTLLTETGAKVVPPKGGFYIFPDFSPLSERLAGRGITTGSALASRALDACGVAFLPGSAFGRPAGELTARMAFVDFDGATALRQAHANPGGGLPEACRSVVDGVRRFCDWLR